MNRRKYILGVSSLAAGSAAAMGTGAFTSVAADRDVTVEVAEDADAYLALQSTSEFVTDENGMFSLDLSADNPTSAGGEGVNANADTLIKDAFRIENRGTETIVLSFDNDGGDNEGEIELGDPFNDGIYIEIFTNDIRELDPGEDASFHVKIKVDEDPDVETIDETITVVAEATDD